MATSLRANPFACFLKLNDDSKCDDIGDVKTVAKVNIALGNNKQKTAKGSIFGAVDKDGDDRNAS